MPRLIFFITFFLLLVPAHGEGAQGKGTDVAYLIEINGPIGPATSDYVHRSLKEAQDQKASLVILRIDTPGGLDVSMRAIVKDISGSTIPVVSFVGPSGSRAASAGTHLVYASHVAAMAPGTNIGAATPVSIGVPANPFRPLSRDKGENDESGKPEVGMNEKVINDAVAYIRSLAQMRGRNADWAERAVREAASLPAEQALKEGVIDILATDLDNLLVKLHGRTVTAAGSDYYLDTAVLRIVVAEPDWRTDFLAIITNPNVAYVLMLIGVYGILLEFYNPGVLIPGIIGTISLLLALYAFQLLPVNYAGLGLLMFGIALMVAEAFVPSFGALGLGGVAAFVIGSVMLLDTDIPGYGISWTLIGSIALVSSGGFLFVFVMLMRARRRAVVTGPEQMIGGFGRVIDWSDGRGRIRIHGEVWQAQSSTELPLGSRVQVESLDGLTLTVSPEGRKKESS